LHIIFLDIEIQVPDKTVDSTFVFSISNGSVFDIVKTSDVTDYETANQSCKAKGGYLVVIDSPIKQDIIEDLIRQHLTNFTLQKASYLIGKMQCTAKQTFYQLFQFFLT